MHKPTFGTVFGASLLYTSGSALDKGQFSVGLELYFMIHAFKIGPSLVLVSENIIVGLTGGFAFNHLGRRYQ
jgi:hypothetical protein